MRIALISDSHVSADCPQLSENAKAARRWIEAIRPDAVVHLGDITADAVVNPEQLAFARRLFEGMPAAMRWLPGNHDIGDNPGPTKEPLVNAARLADFRSVLGPDRWSLESEGWRVIGLNALLIGSGLPEEHEQREWLARELEPAPAHLGLMLHKPFFRDASTDTEAHVRYLPVAARRELESRFAGKNLRFVAAGHTHQLRRLNCGSVEHVWAPSIAYSIPDGLQETIGRKVVGAMILELRKDGYAFAFAEPPSVVPYSLSDFPELYRHLATLRPG